jgi:hypothetical protein
MVTSPLSCLVVRLQLSIRLVRLSRHLVIAVVHSSSSLHLRQRLIERIFESKYQEITAGEEVYAGYELEGFVDESVGAEIEAGKKEEEVGDYPVRARVKSVGSGEVSTIRA